MTELYCPQCSALIPEGERVCPSCGFDLAEFDKEAEDEFNALLNAANKKLSEDSDDEGQEGAPEAAADMAVPDNGTVTQEMIDAMMGGGSAPAPAAPSAPSASAASAAAPAAGTSGGADGTEAEEAPADGKKGKKKQKQPKPEKAQKEPKTPKEPKAPKEKKAPKAAKGSGEEKAPREKKGISPFIITLIAAVVAAALGFCASLLFFTDFIRTAEEDFAIKAANAVNSRLNINEKLCVYKAYVKNSSSADECMIYAVIDYSDSVTVTRYRVVVNRDNPGTINIYYPVDETSRAYLDMKNSDDPEVRIQASVLKNYSDTIDNANREILMGSSSWKEVDPVRVNGSVTSKQTRNTGSSGGKGPAKNEEK